MPFEFWFCFGFLANCLYSQHSYVSVVDTHYKMPHRKGPMGGGGADNVLIVSRALSSSRVQRPSRIAQNIPRECLHSRLDCSIVSRVGTSLTLLMKWECPAGLPTLLRLWIGQGSRSFLRGRVGVDFLGKIITRSTNVRCHYFVVNATSSWKNRKMTLKWF